MKPYDKKDNDTYTHRYSSSMSTDVEMHMFADEKGRVTSNGVRGNFSEESRVAAYNNVLHFETAKTLGLTLIKHKTLSSLVPLSLMQRYEMQPIAMQYTQKVPVFFDAKTERFAVCMDYRILRDLEGTPAGTTFKKEIMAMKGAQDLKDSSSSSPSSHSPLHSSGGSVGLTSTSRGEQIVLYYDSIASLCDDQKPRYSKDNERDNRLYSQVSRAYLKAMLSIFPCEDTIVLKYSLQTNEMGQFHPKGSYSPIISKEEIPSHLFSNTLIDFEFVKACKISKDQYFFYGTDGKLDTRQAFYFDKTAARSAQGGDKKWDNFFAPNNQLMVVPYSDKDWEVLVALKHNVDSIFGELNNLLGAQKDPMSGIDKPLSDIAWTPGLKTIQAKTTSDDANPDMERTQHHQERKDKTSKP